MLVIIIIVMNFELIIILSCIKMTERKATLATHNGASAKCHVVRMNTSAYGNYAENEEIFA